MVTKKKRKDAIALGSESMSKMSSHFNAVELSLIGIS